VWDRAFLKSDQRSFSDTDFADQTVFFRFLTENYVVSVRFVSKQMTNYDFKKAVEVTFIT